MRRFYDLYHEAAQECGDTTSGFLVKARNLAFNAMEDVYNEREWWFAFETDPVVVPQYAFEVGLPERMADIRLVYIRDRNDPLDFKSASEIEVLDHGKNQEGTPERYCFVGKGVLRQLSSALTVVSSDAADTTQTLTVYGMFRGRMVSEAIELNGTTGVESTYQFDEIEIQKCVLDAVCAGTVTATSNSGAVTNFTITIGDTSPSGTFLQPSDRVKIISTSASDNTDYSAYLTGIHGTYPSVRFEETAALNGVADVQATTRIQKLLSAVVTNSDGDPVNGTVIIKDSDDNVLTYIEAGNKSHDNLVIGIHPIVTTDTTIHIYYKQTLMKKGGDNDTLDPFPNHFFSAIKTLAKSKMYFDLGFPNKGRSLLQEFDMLMQPLRVEDFYKQNQKSTIDAVQEKTAEIGWGGTVS